jgi:16S rRNA (guanine527-N7)-methyltransferase
MNKEEFIKYVKELEIDISEHQTEMLERYYNLLVEWNEKINLTAITEKEQVYLKHFYDSLTLSKIYDFNQNITLCDIGTGAGFPGLVLKIVFPNIKVTLVDSLNKRVVFLKEVIKELNLNGIEAIHARAEDYVLNNRNKFDIVTSRAVARLNILTELCLPLAKINGYFIAMKGNASEELDETDNNLKILNSVIEKTINFELPFENSIRMLIKIKRVGNIDKKYPRNFDKIKKNPL